MKRFLPFFAVLALTNCSSHEGETSLQADENAKTFLVREVPQSLAPAVRKSVGETPFVVEDLFKIGCTAERCVYVVTMPEANKAKDYERFYKKFGWVEEAHTKHEATGHFVQAQFGTIEGVDIKNTKAASALVGSFRDVFPIDERLMKQIKEGSYTEVYAGESNSVRVWTADKGHGWSVSASFYKIQDNEISSIDPLASMASQK